MRGPKGAVVTVAHQNLSEGQLAACIAEVLSAVHGLHGTRAPDRTDCYVHDDVVHCVMRDTLAPKDPNRALAERARGRRHTFGGAMREDLLAAVGDLSGREVIAALDAHHTDPDIASEVFILAPRPKPVAPPSAPPRAEAAPSGTEPASTAQATAEAGLANLEEVYRLSGVRLRRAQESYDRRYPRAVQRDRVMASMVKRPGGPSGKR